MVIAYIDGLAQPSNPGTGTYGYLIYDGQKKISEEHGLAGRDVTSNFAEYTALVMVLKRLRQLRLTSGVKIRSDSKLVVGQMSGAWKAKRGSYLEKFVEATHLAKDFDGLEFEWIPREQNAEADLLTRLAYAQHHRR